MPYLPDSDLVGFVRRLAQAGGGHVRLPAGGRFRADFSQLPERVGNVHLHGNGATVEIVGVPPAPDAVRFEECSFERTVFTAPSIPGPLGPFAGYGCVRNSFRHNTFIDFAPSIIHLHGRGLVFEHNRVVQSDRPPPVMYSNVFAPLGDLLFRGNEMNFAPGGPPGRTATGILVGASGPLTAGQHFSNWWIVENRFLEEDRPGFTIDTIVDLEAGNPAQPTSLENVWVERNVCFNGKIDFNSGHNVWVRDNAWHITGRHAAEAGAQASMFYMIATGGQPGGIVRIEGNTYVQHPDAPPGVKAQAVLVVPQVSLRELAIRGNTFVVNGAGTAPEPPGVVGVRFRADAPPGTVIDSVEIADNVFGFTSAPANPGALLAVTAAGSGTGVGVRRLTVRHNRLMGPSRDGPLPATAGGALVRQFLRLGSPNLPVAVGFLEFADNHADEAPPAGRLLAMPAPIPGLQSVIRGNTPASAPDGSGPAAPGA